MVSVFNAGPAKIPDEVLSQVQSEMLNFADTGMSILEISHRGKEFPKMVEECNELLRSLLDIPDNYKILWLQGGASGQFAAIPLNLIASKDDVVDYIVTGTWSSSAANEAEKYAAVNYVLPKTTSYTCTPDSDQMTFTPNARYVYYCDNETVVGVEFSSVVNTSATLVCDMSSNILSRPVDVSKFGLIYASVQKNVAPAGLAVVIVRDDLINNVRLHPVPKIWDYKLQAAGKSTVNTPNVFSIYVTNLVLKYLKNIGGMSYYEEFSREKSGVIYDIVDNSGGFYTCKIEKDSRSRMNVTFIITERKLEEEFVKMAADRNLVGLKGHRSVGGIRASLYNAVSMEDVKKLADFMHFFKSEHSA